MFRHLSRESCSPCRLIFSAACFAALPLSAKAQYTVQPATYDSLALAGQRQEIFTPGSATASFTDLVNDIHEYANASIDILPEPYLTAEANAIGSHGGAHATAVMTYDLQIVGPKNVKVPIVCRVDLLQTQAERQGGGNSTAAGATVYMDIFNYSNLAGGVTYQTHYAANYADQFGQPLVNTNNFLKDTAFDTFANLDVIQINLEANAVSTSGEPAVTKAYAAIDPYFFIDPSFADASQYSIVLSPGVGNSPVPEPTSIVALSVALLGLVARRRARKSS